MKKFTVHELDMRSEHDKGWAEGLWYAVEQLVIWNDQPSYAEFIIRESGIEEWEFREVLRGTQYETKILGAFLDKVFKQKGGMNNERIN